MLWSKGNGTFGVITSPALADAQAEYVRSWSHRDIRAQRAITHGYWRDDEVITDHDVISADEMASDPLYTEFLARFGLKWCAAVGVAHEGAEFQAALTIQRAAGREEFGHEDRETIRVLGRHVEKSLRLGREMIDRRSLSETTSDVLGRLDVGIYALDQDSRIVFVNDAAKRLPEDTFLVRRGRLAIVNGGKRIALRPALERVLRATREDQFPLAPILLTRPPSEQLILYVIPMASAGLAEIVLRSAQMLLAVIRHPSGSPLDQGLLRELFGLTPAEARLAAIVGAGSSRQAAARQLEVSEETVKSTLARVFHKTGTTRQSELAAYLGGIGLRL